MTHFDLQYRATVGSARLSGRVVVGEADTTKYGPLEEIKMLCATKVSEVILN